MTIAPPFLFNISRESIVSSSCYWVNCTSNQGQQKSQWHQNWKWLPH